MSRRPTTSPPDPLPDSRPYTLAAAYLAWSGSAAVTWRSPRSRAGPGPSSFRQRRLAHYQGRFWLPGSDGRYAAVQSGDVRSDVHRTVQVTPRLFRVGRRTDVVQLSPGLMQDVLHHLACLTHVHRVPYYVVPWSAESGCEGAAAASAGVNR